MQRMTSDDPAFTLPLTWHANLEFDPCTFVRRTLSYYSLYRLNYEKMR